MLSCVAAYSAQIAKEEQSTNNEPVEPAQAVAVNNHGDEAAIEQLTNDEFLGSFHTSNLAVASTFVVIQPPTSSPYQMAESPATGAAGRVFDISKTYSDGPTQPKLSSFAKTAIGSKSRSFNSTWYSRHPLIEYSVSHDSVFCFVCRHFPPASGYADPMFVINGCRNWKKLGDKMLKHDESKCHLEAIARWSAAKHTNAHGSVVNKLDSQHLQQVAQNREALSTLVRVVLFCSRQSIALRGHCESEQYEKSLNRGNFAELCKLLQLEHPEIARKLQALPRNAQYTSKLSQDELIQAAAKVIQKEIVQEIEDAGIFSIIVDEARDISCREQMSVCVRFLNKQGHKIVERFLGFMPVTDLSAAGLATTIMKFLSAVNLPVTSCIAQSYDGASVMSGVNNGVQAVVRAASKNPCPYVHCHAHRLNLVLVDVAKQINWVGETFGLLEAVYAFQSVSPLRHKIFLDTQENEKEVLSIPQQSDTRWVCKYAGVHYFFSRLTCAIEALKRLANSRNKREAADARGLLLQLRSFDFVCGLTLLHDLLPLTQTLSLQLQSSSLDFSASQRLVVGCTASFREKRNDKYFEKIWVDACTKATEIGASLPSLESTSEEKTNKRVSIPSATVTDINTIIYSTTGNRTVAGTTDVRTLHRRKVFEVIDVLIGELERRFTSNDELLNAVSACEPRSTSFMCVDSMQKIAESYVEVKTISINKDHLRAQCDVARNMFTTQPSDCLSAVDVYCRLLEMSAAFPDLLACYQLALTLPVASASAERSFSTLRRIKTHLRSTMADDRLSNLAVIAVERESSDKLLENPATVIDEFASMSVSRRLELML